MFVPPLSSLQIRRMPQPSCALLPRWILARRTFWFLTNMPNTGLDREHRLSRNIRMFSLWMPSINFRLWDGMHFQVARHLPLSHMNGFRFLHADLKLFVKEPAGHSMNKSSVQCPSLGSEKPSCPIPWATGEWKCSMHSLISRLTTKRRSRGLIYPDSLHGWRSQRKKKKDSQSLPAPLEPMPSNC